MGIARITGWKARFLERRGGGHRTGGQTRVAGHAAAAREPAERAYDESDRQFLLRLARQGLEAAVTKRAPPAPDATKLARKFLEPRGCFVTLTRQGALRGCLGHLFPSEPLYRAVLENAASAALRDHRFPPVERSELGQLHVEISVLTEPRALRFDSTEHLLERLRPGVDGVVLRLGDRLATYLPQVWAQFPDKAGFLDHLAEKAGCPASAWRGKDANVSVYEVEAFGEEDAPAEPS